MTRSRTKQSAHLSFCFYGGGGGCSTHADLFFLAPTEFTSVPFPVKALKILIHDLQSGGESATFSAQGGAPDLEDDDDVCIHLHFLSNLGLSFL